MRLVIHNYLAADAGFAEAEHPRGQPGNAGQFAAKPGASAPSGVFQRAVSAVERVFSSKRASAKQFYYHGTISDALDSVKKYGLVPGKGHGADYSLHIYGGFYVGGELEKSIPAHQTEVYLAGDAKTAGWFANFVAGAQTKIDLESGLPPDTEPVVLKIKIPPDQKSKLRQDPKSRGLSAFTFDGAIPPEWIVGYKDISRAAERQAREAGGEPQFEPLSAAKDAAGTFIYAVFLVHG